MDDHQKFIAERNHRISSYSKDQNLQSLSDSLLIKSLETDYSYNFDWLGLPIIQYPQDILALQEIIWKTQPDCIIETGIARGGSLIFYASMLALLENQGTVIGIDIDIRAHNKKRIEAHPLAKYIQLVEGSSIENSTVQQVSQISKNYKKIMVCLDSNHTHSHVLEELKLYAPMTSLNCYCVVFDTIVELMPKGHYANRPWDKGNNPKTAIDEFLTYLTTHSITSSDNQHLHFLIDQEIDHKLWLSASRGGYLKRI